MVIVRIWEGLGNQLFQYAYARSLLERGYDVVLDMDKSFDSSFAKYKNNDSRENVLQHYNITIPCATKDQISKFDFIKNRSVYDKWAIILSKYGFGKYRFYEETEQHFSKRSYDMTNNTYVKGWFQSKEYFKNIRNILINEISLKEIKLSYLNLEDEIKKTNSVGIHVRRGDYVRTHHELSMAYYRNAIKKMNSIKDEVKYYVFSDDISWVKTHLDGEGEFVWVNEDRQLADYEELILMSKCKDNIISNSTFSWWSAWLNDNDDKVVIAPRKWLYGQAGIIPEEWNVI